MSFQTFKCVFLEGDAPKALQYHVNTDSILYVSVNTAGDDTENTGPYYVWLWLIGGECLAVFKGTQLECQKHFHEVKAVLK